MMLRIARASRIPVASEIRKGKEGLSSPPPSVSPSLFRRYWLNENDRWGELGVHDSRVWVSRHFSQSRATRKKSISTRFSVYILYRCTIDIYIFLTFLCKHVRCGGNSRFGGYIDVLYAFHRIERAIILAPPLPSPREIYLVRGIYSFSISLEDAFFL